MGRREQHCVSGAELAERHVGTFVVHWQRDNLKSGAARDVAVLGVPVLFHGDPPRPAFGHGASLRVGELSIVASYHVSHQTTQTGRLTPAMFDAVVKQAKIAALHAL